MRSGERCICFSYSPRGVPDRLANLLKEHLFGACLVSQVQAWKILVDEPPNSLRREVRIKHDAHRVAPNYIPDRRFQIGCARVAVKDERFLLQR